MQNITCKKHLNKKISGVVNKQLSDKFKFPVEDRGTHEIYYIPEYIPDNAKRNRIIEDNNDYDSSKDNNYYCFDWSYLCCCFRYTASEQETPLLNNS